jgi:hypothetical protein
MPLAAHRRANHAPVAAHRGAGDPPRVRRARRRARCRSDRHRRRRRRAHRVDPWSTASACRSAARQHTPSSLYRLSNRQSDEISTPIAFGARRLSMVGLGAVGSDARDARLARQSGNVL